MSRMLALELNDTGLRVGAEPAIAGLEPSPGWAAFEPHDHEIRVGRAAAERIRVNPRLAHRRIWGELDLTPLPRPFPRGLSTADLAYAHLRAVWESAERAPGGAESEIEGRLLVAPGSFTVEQLGLVLGIAESLGSPFTGVVDSAVAAASTLASGPSLVLDLELGRAVATRLEVAERRLVRHRVRSRQGAGWDDLTDGWARAVSRAFVTSTRFDPLHTARSDQELYLELPGWIEALTELDSTEAVMRGGDREHRIALSRTVLVSAAEPIYARIVELVRSLAEAGESVRLLVTDRVRRAPGLLASLVEAGVPEPALLPPTAALDGALRWSANIHAPGEASPRWVTELPLAGTVPIAETSSAGTMA